MDFQPDGGLRMAVCVVNITIVALLEPSGIDTADAPAGLGNNSNAFRQVNGRLADAAVNGDIVVVFGHAAKIHPHFTDPHVDLEAPQPQIADIQAAFADSEVYDQIEGFVVVKTKVPAVVGIRMVYVGRFF